MKIWISSFIPKEIDDYTRPVPDGSGDTMIPGPTPLNDCFHTDQRSFSKNSNASARMRSMVSIDIENMKSLGHIGVCGETIECDCEDGQKECEKTASANRLKYKDEVSSDFHLNFTLEGAANNPCFFGSPDIDWVILVHVTKYANGKIEVEATSDSRVEKFPAYEMYAEYDGDVKTIFRRSPDEGATPGDLIGVATQPVQGVATFS